MSGSGDTHSELVDELGGEETPEGTLRAAEAAVTELRDELRIAEASHAARVERIAVLTAAVERAGRLREELEKQRAEQSVYYSLALDLRSDRFQAFLLEETFRVYCVRCFGSFLWDLTARYRFEWQNEAFYVVNYDNARGASIPLAALLASLALALQLTEQVQKASTARQCWIACSLTRGSERSIPKRSNAAAGAIETLPIGGRMVGIISRYRFFKLAPSSPRPSEEGGREFSSHRRRRPLSHKSDKICAFLARNSSSVMSSLSNILFNSSSLLKAFSS